MPVAEERVCQRDSGHTAEWQPLTLAIVAAFLFSGLIGHQPWKPDEAYVFGAVLSILETGQWIVPMLGGEPFMEKPPLYYAAAAATAWLFSPVLEPHDGARIASACLVLIAIVCVSATARKLFGPGRGEAAGLLLVACFGLVQHAHHMLPDLGLLAGFAMSLLGLAMVFETPRRAGLLIGTGVGVGFMSKGVLEPGVMALTCAALPVCFAQWRSPRYAVALGWSLLAFLPWLVLWPAQLYLIDPALFVEWFWKNNVGRYFGFANLGADYEPWHYASTLPWFTFPAGALAPCVLASRWKNLKDRPGLALCATLAVVLLAVLAGSASARQLYVLPLLVPLAVMASAGAGEVGERVMRGFTAAIGVVAAGFAAFVWGIWAYGVVKGTPPPIPLLLRWLPGDFDFRLRIEFVVPAIFITMLWLFVWVGRRKAWLHRWVASIVLLWGVTMSLLLPWIDSAKSFRDPFMALAREIPPLTCLSSSGLGEPQRAMLHYYAGIKTLRTENGAEPCAYHLVQPPLGAPAAPPPAGTWTLVSRAARSGETREVFSLFARDGVTPVMGAGPLPAEPMVTVPSLAREGGQKSGYR